MTLDPFMAGTIGLCLFTAGAWWGARQEHGNWLNSARVGTSQRGRDGVFYRVTPEGDDEAMRLREENVALRSRVEAQAQSLDKFKDLYAEGVTVGRELGKREGSRT